MALCYIFHQWSCAPLVSVLYSIVRSNSTWIFYPTRLLIPWLWNFRLLMWLSWYILLSALFPLTLEIGILLPLKFHCFCKASILFLILEVLLFRVQSNAHFLEKTKLISFCSLPWYNNFSVIVLLQIGQSNALVFYKN